ncbi:MAG: type IV secretory system conjugative DNA transfer family protein [Ahrensia sp.]|nr:type IV secretory system conjugative DNA transfer family protein [Ahrensia sp.]
MTYLTPPTAYPYKEGNLFLGLGSSGDVGVSLERHAITVAGARSGKGACAIIPNLLRWPHSALVIDPKGENAVETYKTRGAFFGAFYVLDPFRTADVPDEARAAFNPLAVITADSLTAREDVEVIADGLVKRSDPKHAQWDDGAAAILAGIIAFVITDAPEDKRTLKSVRGILLQSRDDLYNDAQSMLECDGCGGLAKAAGVAIMTAIESEKGMEKEFLEGARRHSKWLDSPAVSSVLDHSTFDLADLKKKPTTVYVVLPPQYLETHAAFMRLFVRCAINVMAVGGSGKGEKCLFILDEFFALGRIDEISKSCGLMPSYGVHLWPFLQDLGQLKNLYHGNLWETFFANSDAAMFFGNTDTTTTEYVSKRIGNVTPQELNVSPPEASSRVEHDQHLIQAIQADYTNAMTEYNRRTKEIGTPRLPPDKVASIVGKRDGDVVASSMLVFAKGGDILHLKLAPYFQPTTYTPPQPVVQEQPPIPLSTNEDEVRRRKKIGQDAFNARMKRDRRNTIIFYSVVCLLVVAALQWLSNWISG